jgi:hypothetical protein
VIPEVGGYSIDDLLTPLLIWDSVVCVTDEKEQEKLELHELAPLIDSGAVTCISRPKDRLDATLDRWVDIRPTSPQSNEDNIKVSEYTAELMLQYYIEKVEDAIIEADRRGLASVASSELSWHAATLPSRTRSPSEAEAALIQVASAAIAVAPGTKIEDILYFREKHGLLMGRFRGALIDLAQSLNREADTAVLMEEAHAVIKNRVEPALGHLESALSRGSIRYAWTMLMGASTIVLGSVEPAAMTVGSGRLIAQTLAYAFDRQRLLLDHPYGLIPAARAELRAQPQPLIRAINDPLQELKRIAYMATLLIRELTPEDIAALRRTSPPDVGG